MIRLVFQSRLAAPAAKVLAEALTMDGVNRELGPWIYMTSPRKYRNLATLGDLAKATEPLGPIRFGSAMLFLRCIPIDWHRLYLERVIPDLGFDENSDSLTQREWVHRRRIEPVEGGCKVRDELRFEPRFRVMQPLLRWIVTALFRHRHRRLRARFGRLHDAAS